MGDAWEAEAPRNARWAVPQKTKTAGFQLEKTARLERALQHKTELSSHRDQREGIKTPGHCTHLS